MPDTGRQGGGPGLHRLAVLTAGATLLLIAAGGLVTSTESGLAVPDWPTTYGENPFTFAPSKWVGGIRFEHGHRLIASAVGLLTIVLAIWLARREPRRAVRRLGYLAVAAVVGQGILGGLTVLFLLPTAISVAHACLAQIFFCVVVSLAVVTSRGWTRGGSLPAGLATRVGAAAAAATFLQLLIGAVMRHTKAGLAIPDFPLALGRLVPPLDSFPVAIHFAHRAGAVVVAAGVIGCVVAGHRSGRPGLFRSAVGLLSLVGLQIALGAATVLLKKPVPLATAHVAAGALLLGAVLAWTLSSRRSPRPASMPQRAPALASREAVAWK